MSRAIAIAARMLVALGLLGTLPVSAETLVSGAIVADAHWKAVDGPFVLSGAVTITQGARLTVDPGVTIQMAPAASFTVDSGVLWAIGTTVDPIIVQSLRSREGSAAAGDYLAWTIAPHSVQSRLEHVRFEHGSGLVISGSAPELVYVDIRDQRGAAIQIDLQASPTGYGLAASGNEINGILVPAGDIVGSVRWGLRGIPYVVEGGAVSVGQSPTFVRIEPDRIERGQTATLVVDGSRLSGVGDVIFDADGLQAVPFSGGTATRFSMQAQASPDARLGPASLRLQLDAGELIVPAAVTIVQPQPSITSISPSTVEAGSGVRAITVTGRNFAPESEVLVNSAVIPTQFLSATELRGSLPNQSSAATLPLQVRSPDGEQAGQFLSSNSVNLLVTQPVLPTMSFEPSPVAMPPDGQTRDIVLRLSKAATSDHVVALSISDTGKAQVAPASLTIPAGATTAVVSITPIASGSVSLRAESATLGTVSAPVFITADFLAASTAYAPHVGVVVEQEPEVNGVETGVHAVVGVSVGAVLESVSPGGWAVGSTQRFDLRGYGIPSGSQVEVVSAADVTVAPATVSEGGALLQVEIHAGEGAEEGPRRLVVRDPNGSALSFADPARGVVWLGQGAPEIHSVAPVTMLRGASVRLTIRGESMRNGTLEVLPADGLAIDANPTINTAGTELAVNVIVDADAALGPRLIRVTTPAGSTSSELADYNTVSVVDGTPTTFHSHSPVVGVQIEIDAESLQRSHGPIASPDVGVVLGAVVTSVSPKVGVVASSLELVIRGQALQDVTTVAIEPAVGLEFGALTSDGQGTELRVSLQIDADAALGLRSLRLLTATGPVPFLHPEDAAFLVSAPLPELDSTTPQVLTRGGAAQSLVIRGRNLLNIADVRFEPASGITANPPFSVTADGAMLTFTVTVDDVAPSGARTIIITSAAGESTAQAHAGNTVTVADEVGPTYPAILTPLVGVNIPVERSDAYDGVVVAPAIGVLVEPEPEPVTASRLGVADPVGISFGAVALAADADGWLQGTSSVLTITGVGLAGVQSVAIVPEADVLFGAVSIQETEQLVGSGDSAYTYLASTLSVPVSVSSDASPGWRRLRLLTADGEVIWASADAAVIGIGRLPVMNSISPIVAKQGEVLTLSVRGSDLAGVSAAAFQPSDGIEVIGAPVWSQDGLGEMLRFSIRVAGDAALGGRVLQLRVPGGTTSDEPTAANTLTVVQGP
jgi:hypothetical protein